MCKYCITFVPKYCIKAFLLTVKWSCVHIDLNISLRGRLYVDHSTFWCEISLRIAIPIICTYGIIIRTDNIILSED